MEEKDSAFFNLRQGVKIMKKILYILALVFFLAGLTACSQENREFTMHKPGVYKGTVDPPLAKEHDQELINRFKMVQTDR
jgi:hypothetical protein